MTDAESIERGRAMLRDLNDRIRQLKGKYRKIAPLEQAWFCARCIDLIQPDLLDDDGRCSRCGGKPLFIKADSATPPPDAGRKGEL